MEAPGGQQLEHRAPLLFLEDAVYLGVTLRGDVEREQGDHTHRHQSGYNQGTHHPAVALPAGAQHHHLVVHVHAPQHQQDGDVEAERQDHLQELGEPERHHQKQGVRGDLPGGGLG